MILQCRECGKLQEHFVFKENGTWYARCEDCGMRMMLYDITKYLIPIGTEFMLYDGTIGVIKGYSTMHAKKFDDIYYISYPIEPAEERRLECRQMSINVREMPECVRRYEISIQDKRESVKEENDMNKDIVYDKSNGIEQKVDTNATMDILLFDLLKGLDKYEILDIINKYKENIDAGNKEFVVECESADKYTTAMFGFKKHGQNIVGFIYALRLSPQFEITFYAPNGFWDIFGALEAILKDSMRDKRDAYYYSSRLKNILYERALRYDLSTLVELARFRDVYNPEGSEVILPDNLHLLRIINTEMRVIRLCEPYADDIFEMRIIAEESELDDFKIFDPWLDILIQQKLL